MFRSSVWHVDRHLLVYIIIAVLLNSSRASAPSRQWLLTPVFLGGIMLGCDALDAGEPLRVAHLFDGFKGPHFVPLLLIGVVNLALCVLTVVVAVVVLAAGVGMSGLMNLTDLRRRSAGTLVRSARPAPDRLLIVAGAGRVRAVRHGQLVRARAGRAAGREAHSPR